nr:MAG: hypothetical protein [Bacteriophage sp.]
MKVYIDENYEVYTEETIDKEIARRFSDCNYDGVVEYIANTYSEAEIFAMLPSNIQAEILEDAKRWILENDFYEREIDEPNCPLSKCPYTK